MYIFIDLEKQEVYFEERLGTIPILIDEHKSLLETFKNEKDKIARREDGTFYVVYYEPTEEEKEQEKRQKAQEEIDHILEWFKANDWKANKITLEEWEHEDPRALEYLHERKEKRERHAELCNFLGIENDRE